MKGFIIILFATILYSCSKEAPNITENNIPFKLVTQLKNNTYLALGDSYTIGEAVPLNSSFPFQLTQVLKKDSINVAEPKIIAKTGWTTDELISAIKSSSLQPKYDFVSLLIGVNNQYRNYDTVTYRKEFRELLQTAIKYAGNKAENVFVLSIPDWGVTPFAKNSGKKTSQIAKEIDFYNLLNKEETAKTKAVYLDITPISREAISNLNLIASDGLHPSAQMYEKWVEKLAPMVKSQLF